MRIALGCAVLALCLGAQAAGNVAFVADIKGNATIEGDGKLNFLAELSTGTRLLLGTGASASITYAATGAEFTLTGPGEFLVAPAEIKAEKGPAPMRHTVAALADPGVVARVSQAATASARMRGVVPGAGIADKAALEYPVDTRVASLHPVMRLRDGTSVEGAMLTLLDADGREVWKGQAKSAATRSPVRLAPATRYTWIVMAPKGALGEAHFETLSAEAMARVEKSRSGARNFADRVMHAFLLQDAGATQDAREAWAALARERPDLAELAILAR
ncbi:MAG: hypothetical protein ACXWFW_13840 [Usitatibacter sp.]